MMDNPPNTAHYIKSGEPHLIGALRQETCDMDRRHRLALWAGLGAMALTAAWVVRPGVMAWRTRSEVYTAAMRQCLADQEGGVGAGTSRRC